MPKGIKRTDVIKSEMKVVILHGKHNCGKTTTINKLFDKLIANGASFVEPKKELPGRDDFECVLKYNGKTIALFSLGDYMFAIGAAVGYYTRAKCDVLVVAHSLETPIYKNSLFRKREYPYCIINKEENGVIIEDADALNKLMEAIG